MWTIFAGDRRPLTAVVALLVLLAVALVVAVILSSGPPAAGPAGSTSPSPSASQTPSATPWEAATATATETAPAPAERVPTVPVPAEPGPVPPNEPPATVPVPPAPAPAAPFPAALAGHDVEVLPGAGPVVALTFDAGGNSAGLASILQTLRGAGVHGTFFLTGSWAAANPRGVASIVAGGHRVGNHSMTHPGFTGLSDAAIGEEVLGAQQAIQAAGADSRPLFRFPFGERDARTIAAVNSLGYVPVRWTVDTLGWKGTSGGVAAQVVADRVLANLQPGEIVLMHVGSNPDDGTTLDADALLQVINRIRQAGYGFTALDQLLR
ncbi:polysaccharide deacetylase family protein [Pseudarthrobacter sp. H2]|uniref:polysaccharide deacetylase family protein n=1 Tax=Pseudarthrobacter sp. H2 TaxID=3418415 RepID=UPI003CF640DA